MEWNEKLGLCLATLVATAPVVMAFNFNDNNYHEVVLFEWDTARIDVVIVPPATSSALWRMDALRDSVQAWEDGIKDHPDTPAWLRDGLEIDIYVEGVDDVPDHVVQDVEVFIVSAEPGVLGIGIPLDFFVCGEERAPGWTPSGIGHQHEDSAWKFVNNPCADNTDNVCFVINTNWRLNNNGLYDLNSHELGHCLGIGHVGDANDFSARNYPGEDIMSYQKTVDQVHCVSSLNIIALQASFADILGESWPNHDYYAWDPGYPYVHQAPTTYSQVACENPEPGPIELVTTPICVPGVCVLPGGDG